MQKLRAFLFFIVSVSVCASALENIASAPPQHDMNKMWTEMRSKPEGMAVTVAADEKGGLWLAQMKDGQIWVSQSKDGKTFSGSVVVNAVPESILAEGQNRPQLAVQQGVVAVSWTQATPKPFTGNVRFSRSIDGGKTFSDPATINDDRAENGHELGALAWGENNRMALVWSDSRHRAAAKQAGEEYAGNAIYYVLSEDGGAHFSPNQKLADHACECCRIGVAMDRNNIPVVFWRHVFDGSVRDFALARLNAQKKILRVSDDNWHINACPHHGGDMAVDENNGIHLAWFTGSSPLPGLFYRRVDGNNMTAPHHFGNSEAQASYPAVFARGHTVQLAWREFDGNGYQLMTSQSVDRGDHWSPARVVAVTRDKADIPEFVVNAQKPLLVWNSKAEGVQVFDVGSH